MRGNRFALVLLSLGGCEYLGAARPEGRPVVEAHAGSRELRVLDVDSPMRARQKIPILRTPEVFAAYVPAHVERDLLIGDHWIYFKLKDAEFFVEELQDPDIPLDGDASIEQIKPLNGLDWKRFVVPYRDR